MTAWIDARMLPSAFDERQSLAWWEELLLRDPRFRARVAQARGSLREGRGTPIEELREKYGVEPSAKSASEHEEGLEG